MSEEFPFFVVRYHDSDVPAELRRKDNGEIVTTRVARVDTELLAKSATYFWILRENQRTELWQVNPARPLVNLDIGIDWSSEGVAQDSYHYSPEGQTLAIRDGGGRAYLLDLAWLTAAADESLAAPVVSCLPFAVHPFNANVLSQEEYLGEAPSLACPEYMLLLGQARLAARRQDVQGATKYFEAALELEPTLSINPVTEANRLVRAATLVEGNILANDARRLLLAGELTAAADTLREAQAKNEQVEINAAVNRVARGHVEQGQEFINQNRFDEAAQKFAALVELEALFGAVAIDQEIRLQAAQGFIAIGERFAENGQVEAATGAFANALIFDPTIEIDPAHEARAIAAQMQWARGRSLAQALRIAEAIKAFESAKELDATIDIDPQMGAAKFGAEALVAQGQRLAKWGDTEGALAKFAEAQRLYPSLELDPAAEVTRLAPTATPISSSPLATPTPVSESPSATPIATVTLTVPPDR